jgi:hypothetical protein
MNDSVESRGRKKIRNEAEWKRNVLKRRRNRGEEYVSITGRLVPGKVSSNLR